MKKYVFIVIIGLIITSAMFYFLPAKKSIYVVSMTADEMSTGLANGSIAGFISWQP